jgi:hypothetical protein
MDYKLTTTLGIEDIEVVYEIVEENGSDRQKFDFQFND